MKALRNSIIATAATALFVFSLQVSRDHRYDQLRGDRPPRSYDYFHAATLGLEYEGINRHMSPTVVPISGMSSSGFFRENLKASGQQPARQIGGVSIESKMEGAAARLQVWLVFNDMRNPEWRKNKEQESLGSFLLREGASARIDRLAQYGYEPFTIKAVSARPKTLQPDQWAIRNRTQALEVVEIKKRLDNYFIMLRNRSSKSVVAYQIGDDYPSGGGGSVIARLALDDITPPSANLRTIQYHPTSSWRMTPQGLVREMAPGIVIRLAVFSDRSFEGDEEVARGMFTECDGRRKELTLVLPMLKQLLDLPQAQLPGALERLKTRISEIPQEEKRVRTSKQLSPEQQEEWQRFESGMYEGRNLIQWQIEQLQERLSDSKFPVELNENHIRDSIRRIIADCERWMNHPV